MSHSLFTSDFSLSLKKESKELINYKLKSIDDLFESSDDEKEEQKQQKQEDSEIETEHEEDEEDERVKNSYNNNNNNSNKEEEEMEEESSEEEDDEERRGNYKFNQYQFGSISDNSSNTDLLLLFQSQGNFN